MIWFVAKVVIGIFVFVWLRGTLPRCATTSSWHLGWKVLIPINLVWILAVSRDPRAARPRLGRWKATALPLAIVLLVIVVPGADGRRGRRRPTAADAPTRTRTQAQRAPTFPVAAARPRRPDAGRKARPMAPRPRLPGSTATARRIERGRRRDG